MSLTPQQHQQAATMLADGCSYREISRTLNINRDLLSATFPGQGWTYTQAGEFTAAMRQRHTTCSIRGCDGDHLAKGMCSRHYHAARTQARKAAS